MQKTFKYEALNETGKPIKDTIEASNTNEAIARIRSQGLFPTSVREARITNRKSSVNNENVIDGKLFDEINEQAQEVINTAKKRLDDHEKWKSNLKSKLLEWVTPNSIKCIIFGIGIGLILGIILSKVIFI